MRKLLYFDSFVNESTEVLTVSPRPINSMERELLKKFQELVLIVYEFDGGRLDNFEDFESRVSDYLRFPFARTISNFVNKVRSYKSERDKIKDVDSIIERHDKTLDQAMRQFRDGKMDKKLLSELAELNAKLAKSTRTSDQVAKELFYNPYKLSSMRGFFGGRKTLVGAFDKDDLDDFKKLDLDEPLYTYLNFPRKKMEDFESILYFVKELTDDPKPRRIEKSKVKTFADYLNDGSEEYAKFVANVDSYLYNNNKKLIEDVLDGIKKYPELYKANEKSKNKITNVFRGVGFYREDNPPNKEELIKNERDLKYVATSTSESVARRFAEMRGHLERERRSHVGYIIEYEVDSESVVLDATIFDSPYGEGEILIDASKAKVKNVKKI
jgi:hypothetical protein